MMSYSATVSMRLEIRGKSYDVAKSGPDYLVLRNPATIDGGSGTFHTIVDGREHTWRVLVPDVRESEVVQIQDQE